MPISLVVALLTMAVALVADFLPYSKGKGVEYHLSQCTMTDPHVASAQSRQKDTVHDRYAGASLD